MPDPYTALLKIPAGQRPPTHYQLLGVSPLTQDPSQIEAAARNQLPPVGAAAKDVPAQVAARLEEEIGRARETLTDPQRRREYDESLRTADPWWKSEVPASPPPPTAFEPVDLPWWAEVPEAPGAPPVPPHGRAPAAPARPSAPPPEEVPLVELVPVARRQSLLGVAVGAVVGLGAAAAVGFFLLRPDKPPPAPPEPPVSVRKPPTATEKRTKPPLRAPDGREKPTPAPKIETPAPPPSVGELAPAGRPPEEEGGARLYRGHEGPVQAVAITPDGKRLLSLAADKKLLVWDAGVREPVLNKEFKIPPVAAAALPDGGRALVATEGAVHLLDLSSGEELRQWANPRGNILGLAVAPGGRHFLTAVSDGTARLWEVGKAEEVHAFDIDPNLPVTCVAVSPDGRWVLAGCGDGSVTLVDVVRNRSKKQPAAHPGGISALAFAPDLGMIITAGADRKVRFWDGTFTRDVIAPTEVEAVVLALRFCDARRLLAAGPGETVHLWDVASRKRLEPFKVREGANSIAVDRDGRLLLVGGRDSVLRLYRLPEER